MKLILCLECQDMFSLRADQSKTCVCGKSQGQYRKCGLKADYSGPCLPLGIDNNSLNRAIRKQPEEGMGEPINAFVIPRKCPTFFKKD